MASQSFRQQFDLLVGRINQLIHTDPYDAYKRAMKLQDWAVGLPFGNDVNANRERFIMIDAARHLITKCKLAIVARGGMVSADPDPDLDDIDDATVIPIQPKN